MQAQTRSRSYVIKTFFCVWLRWRWRIWRTYFLGIIPWNQSGITPVLKADRCCVWSPPLKFIISPGSSSKRSRKPAKNYQKCMRHTQALRWYILKEVKKILLKQSPGRKVASLLKLTYVHPPCSDQWQNYSSAASPVDTCEEAGIKLAALLLRPRPLSPVTSIPEIDRMVE